jgi:hypothetical protein
MKTGMEFIQKHKKVKKTAKNGGKWLCIFLGGYILNNITSAKCINLQEV